MFYFAYGSNMQPQRMYERCPYALPQRVGYISGYQLVFNKLGIDGTSKANIQHTGKRTDRVYGMIYEITDTDLRSLDMAEGFPKHYQRRKIRVYMKRDIAIFSLRCLIYTSTLISKEPLCPSPEYLFYVVDGAAQSGLPADYIQRIADTKTQATHVKQPQEEEASASQLLEDRLGAARFVRVMHRMRDSIERLSNKEFMTLVTFYNLYYGEKIPTRIRNWKKSKYMEAFRKRATNMIMGIHPVVGKDSMIEFVGKFFEGRNIP